MQFWRSYKRAWRSINEIEFCNGHVERIDRRQWNKYRSIAYKYFATPMQFFRLFRDFRTSSHLFPSSPLLGYQCFRVFSSPLSVSLASSSPFLSLSFSSSPSLLTFLPHLLDLIEFFPREEMFPPNESVEILHSDKRDPIFRLIKESFPPRRPFISFFTPFS